MGRCQHAGTSKNKKVTENFPSASVLVCGLRNKIYLKKYYSRLKLVRSKIIFVLSSHDITELFKNSKKKVKQKFAIGNLLLSQSFSGKHHQNAPLFDISPLFIH
jgi:hypothetical protein